MVTQQQIKIIHTLLAKHPLLDKKELVLEYTNKRETSTTKLTYGEANDLIHDLQRMGGMTEDQLKADRQRKKIIHMAHQMMWYGEDGKVDMERINNWCVHYGKFHKPLNNHTLKELPALITQFEAVYKSFLKGI